MLAVLAGAGRLPAHLLAARPDAVICTLEGFAPDLPAGLHPLPFRLEGLGTLLDNLAARGVRDLCLAGAVSRVPIDPERIDAATRPLLPALTAALAEGGDDAALRALAGLLEARGFTLRAPHDIAPDLLPPAGVLAGALTPKIRAMATRGMDLLDALSPFDLGQGCVIAGTRVAAIEAAPGTDWMLASLKGGEAAGGVFCKAPKAGQDRRLDLPVIGPATIAAAARAGLGAVVIAAGGVMVLERAATGQAARDTGVTLWVR